jgi:hypothetical protein
VLFGLRAAVGLLLPLALVMFGCDPRAIFETMIPKEAAAVGQEVVARIAAGDFAAVEAQLAPDLRTPDIRFKLQEVARRVPAGEPIDVQTIGAHTTRGPKATTYDMTFEYRYPDSWLIANVVLTDGDGGFTLYGVQLTPRSQALEAENAFTFAGKSPMHMVVLALAIVVPLFILFALIVCVRTALPRRKWLWLAFIAIGVVQFQFNWSTGAWGVRPFAFSIFRRREVRARGTVGVHDRLSARCGPLPDAPTTLRGRLKPPSTPRRLGGDSQKHSATASSLPALTLRYLSQNDSSIARRLRLLPLR